MKSCKYQIAVTSVSSVILGTTSQTGWLDREGGETGYFLWAFFLMLKLYKHKVDTCTKYPQIQEST